MSEVTCEEGLIKTNRYLGSAGFSGFPKSCGSSLPAKEHLHVSSVETQQDLRHFPGNQNRVLICSVISLNHAWRCFTLLIL